MTATLEVANEIQQERPSIQWGNVDIVEFDEYSVEEAKRVWYGENEIASISYEAFCLASHSGLKKSSQSQKRGTREQDQDSMRGLELMTGRRSIGRRSMGQLRNQTSVGKAVLDEQLRQRTMGFHDEGLIAIVSRAESHQDICRALELGREDQESADEILERVREPSDVAPSTNGSPSEQSTPRMQGGARHARMKDGWRMMRFFGRKKG
jgi:hypothetical protein